MNDFLKIISNSLKPFGYHVRKHNTLNIMRIPSLEKNDPNIKSVYHGHLTKDANLNELVIFLRTCLREKRNIDQTPRLTGASLEENAYRCINSLITAINQTHKDMPNKKMRLVVLDDRSDESAQQKLKNLLARLTVHWEMRQIIETGQGKSMHQQFSEGSTYNTLTYFVEDDYLHEPEAITAAWQFYEDAFNKLQSHAIIYPQEHEKLYKDHAPAYILLGRDRHWRSIHHATHTLFTHGHVVRDFWDYFENTKYVGIRKKRKLGSENQTTNKLFRFIPGFSPLKPIATHLQFEDILPPYYDWKPLWEKNKV